MIKVYTGTKSFMASLLFIAGMVLFLFVFFWGITKVIQLFLPLLIVFSYLLIIVFLFGIVPAAHFKYLRPSLCVCSAVMSHALGAATWVMALFIVIKAFGFFGILFIFLFKLLAPVAFVGAMLNGSWRMAGHLAVWISFTYGMKFYSQWLLKPIYRDQGEGHIIDVDAIEVP